MNFASDNTGPAHPRVIEASLAPTRATPCPTAPTPLMERVRDRIREVFEAPEAAVYLVATGTAANSLILATHGTALADGLLRGGAHIEEDECNAPEFFSGGAKLTLVEARSGLIGPEALAAAIAKEESRGVHGPQRGPVSITQATENGTVYDLDEHRRASPRSLAGTACRSTWTARASPTRLSRSAARRPR